MGIAGTRRLSGALASFVRVFAIAFCIYGMFYIWGIFSRLGIIAITHTSNLTIILSGLFVLTFLVFPAQKGMEKSPVSWYDFMLIVAGVIPCAYVFVNYQVIIQRWTIGTASASDQAMFIILFLVLFEALRRVIGLAMPIVVTIIVLYAAFADYCPGILFSVGFNLEMLTHSLYLGTEGVWGVALSAAATMVLPFMVFARLVQMSGAGTFLMDIALGLFGRTRGGAAKAAVVGSSLFGSISGAATANVVTTGSFTIPMMKGTGFPPHTAGAIESVSSNGGVIMPPLMGVVAFIMCEYVDVHYGLLIFLAFLPAVLYYLSEFLVVDQVAAKLNLKGLPPEQLPPSLRKTMLAGWPYILPLVALILLLGVWHIDVGRGALLGCLVLLGAIALKSVPRLKSIGLTPLPREKPIGVSTVLDSLEGGARLMVMPGIACAAAGFIIGAFSISGLGVRLSMELVVLAGGNVVIILALAALLSFILGMGLTSIPCYLVVAVLVAPALVKSGIPLVAAHLFCLYWGVVSYITPPVCITSYVAASIAGAPLMRTGLEASRIGIASYLVPFIFVLHPGLVLQGSPLQIVMDLAIGLVVVYCFAAFTGGWMRGELGWLKRILLLAAGFCVIWPNNLTVMLAGFTILAAIVALQVFRGKGISNGGQSDSGVERIDSPQGKLG